MAEVGTGAHNLAWAEALISGLGAGGVTHAVIAPGSRSTPLVLALDRHPGIELTVIPDERSAAFFALGLGRAAGRPAVFVCTSGSAAAHALPAVLEAEADGVPLIVLSADRPAELQQTGANQTMDQAGLFGRHVRHSVVLPAPGAGDGLGLPRSTGARAVEAARWPLPGPVHLNVAFREPLAPVELPPPPAAAPRAEHVQPVLTPAARAVAGLRERLSGRPGLIVCGRGVHAPTFPRAVTALARGLGAPVLADPLSGLRWGAHDRTQVLTGYDLFLRGTPPPAMRPEWVLQFGATPVSGALERFLGRCGTPRILVAEGGDWQDPSRLAESRVIADPALLAAALGEPGPAPAEAGWLDRWQRAEARALAAAADPALRPPEADIVGALEDGLAADALLFVGNSMPIRALDLFARGRPEPLSVCGNRGLSGIDGNVSTALGLGRGSGRRPSILIGDLTLYHDMNGLLATREVAADLIVLDNGGGAIFGLLPQARLAAFERLWLTPTGLDLRRVADLYALEYVAVAEPPQLGDALSGSSPSTRLLHVRLDRERGTGRFRRLFETAGELWGVN